MRAVARKQSGEKAGSTEVGLTFVEMVATAAILLILAAAILPLARTTIVRQREIELHRALRDMRTAIDEYHDAVVEGRIGGMNVKAGSGGFPPDLDSLVEGVPAVQGGVQQVPGRQRIPTVGGKLKFLRRIPVDPMTSSKDWGLRCYQDDPDDTSWCGDNVWDVYTQSDGTALDGTKYKDW